MPSNQNATLRGTNRHAEHNEQPNEANANHVEEIRELPALDLSTNNVRIGLFNFSEHAGYAIYIDWEQNVAYHYPPTPYHVLAPISLPPSRRLPTLSSVLAGTAGYRPFPGAPTLQNNVPAIIERSRIPVFILAIRLSGHMGDVRMMTLSNEGAAVSVNDVLEAVRAAIAGREPAFAPAAAMAQMGMARRDERGRLVWSGLRDGSEGVWELSLV
ncbi:hypothetical protein BDQ12DRAFT_722516 [Crucibulum laeve]|uniref:Uncharacterized protein n=1 Tax=Crucibulum laeve TaxID=68775 RepID=A0A5C3M2S8_9AGAR|nr:hypothetical protein BDQ12DRAFT_722516 [Crucibulum laeve]